MPFRRTYGIMSFEKRKAMKKFVEDLEREDLVEPTHSDWAAPSLLVPKKRRNLPLSCRLPWSKQTNRENMLAFNTN